MEKENKLKLLSACWVKWTVMSLGQVSYLLFALYTIITCAVESQEFTLAFFNLGKRGNCKSWGMVFRLTQLSMPGGWCIFCTQSLLNVLSLRHKDNTSDSTVSRALTLRFFLSSDKFVLIFTLFGSSGFSCYWQRTFGIQLPGSVLALQEKLQLSEKGSEAEG